MSCKDKSVDSYEDNIMHGWGSNFKLLTSPYKKSKYQSIDYLTGKKTMIQNNQILNFIARV